jgi:hypothetical protein
MFIETADYWVTTVSMVGKYRFAYVGKRTKSEPNFVNQDLNRAKPYKIVSINLNRFSRDIRQQELMHALYVKINATSSLLVSLLMLSKGWLVEPTGLTRKVTLFIPPLR